MIHEPGLLILVFIILALLIGAAVRHALKGSGLPYTVVLLLVGLTMGLAHRLDLLASQAPLFHHSVDLVSGISPHLILYVFLPTLIFESAFSLEAHLFRRMFMQIALLAIPGLMVAALLTALLARWAFPWEWSWALCLLFGTLISATDPVAVVALLKEVSSRKRLETLIEGESLLNDGTAIVLFSLFYALVTLGSGDASAPLRVVTEFNQVVLGGFGVGLAIGGLAIWWIGRVFNDPLIEISLSVVAAYLVFFVAERLHVSGVVALVTLALLFSGSGRTRISPEVTGFLHHFWEVMAHVANTIIFLVVGVLIASRVPLDQPALWQTLGALYLGLIAIRAATIGLFLPLLQKVGAPLTRAKAMVLVWGGLRGAVSLALALTIAADGLLARELTDQILFLCAGIVVLTIVLNGGTMGQLLRLLRLDRLPEAKQATVDRVVTVVNRDLNEMLPGMMTHEFLKGSDWEAVRRHVQLGDQLADTGGADLAADELEVAFRRRLLETERRSYWLQFEQGTLGRTATEQLVHAVERVLDGPPQIGPRSGLASIWRTPPWLEWLRRIAGVRRLVNSMLYRRLALGYDLARGFIQAQEELRSHVEALAPSPASAETINRQVALNCRLASNYIAQVRDCHPELIQALETQAASRLLLNRERAIISQQLRLAVLDQPEATRLLNDVERRMVALQRSPMARHPAKIEQWQRLVPWARDCSEETRAALVDVLETELCNSGDQPIKQGQPLSALGVVIEGSLQLTCLGQESRRCRQLGPGEPFAALALISGRAPASYRASTLCRIGWLSADALRGIMARDPELSRAVASLVAAEVRE
ncbi:cyclic nucleotide-binding domain-containing protein [Ferrimonas sediminicola]|uniref:Cyclic nucleotide-binding domain-containing protein n=1 Tax=Ferrimonas sediminicola TaxID=2569538 RepID=A0A4V5NVP5_9GAMM|nr:cation:proton antiporter [Ferrimonas sediminicola]TKB50443.1 cyclic nucleotide-binding domain-containing protein [Ferrimonas sediminicola]